MTLGSHLPSTLSARPVEGQRTSCSTATVDSLCVLLADKALGNVAFEPLIYQLVCFGVRDLAGLAPLGKGEAEAEGYAMTEDGEGQEGAEMLRGQ